MPDTTSARAPRQGLTVLLALVAGVLIGAVGMAALTLLPDALDEWTPPDRSDVLVLGDSLSVGSRTSFEQMLPAAGFTPMFEVMSGRTTAQGVTVVQDLQSRVPRRVVVALGTNDVPRSPAAFAAQMTRLLDALGPQRQVYWVNVYIDTRHASSAFDGYRAINARIAAVAAGRPNVTVLDWNAYAAKQRGLGELPMTADGVHYTDPGSAIRARYITDQLVLHSDDPTPTSTP